jgi:hypothetical protein
MMKMKEAMMASVIRACFNHEYSNDGDDETRDSDSDQSTEQADDRMTGQRNQPTKVAIAAVSTTALWLCIQHTG